MKRASLLAAPLVLAPAPGRAQTFPTIHVASPPQEGIKAVHYGIRAGIFSRVGLNVEVVAVSNGAAALAALAGGSIEVALSSILPFFQAYARGLPFAIVAPGQQYLSDAFTQALFVKKGSPIRRGSDLTGKVVGVPSIKDMNWAGTAAWIDATGGDSRSVKFIELPFSSVLPAIVEGRVDVATLSAPYIQQGIASGAVQMLAKNYDVIGKQLEVAAYIGALPFITANREEMTRFSHAMHDASHYANTHPAEMVELVAGFTGVDPAIVAKGTRTIDPDFVDPHLIQPLLDLAYRYQLVEHPLTVDELVAPTALRPPH